MQRNPVRQETIVSNLRARIVSGKLGPGDRLPPRALLEKEFSASSVTVQNAFDRLVADGFVVACGRRGTFVSDLPPHLHRYALALPFSPEVPQWSQYFKALLQCSERIASMHGRNLSVFKGLAGARHQTDHNALVKDIRTNCVAGMILVGNASLFSDELLQLAHMVPSVLLAPEPMTDVCSVDLGGAVNIVDHALDHFVKNGKKRLAAIFPSGIETCRLDYFRSAVQKRDIQCPSSWMHGIDVVKSGWVGNVLELLFSGPVESRPDSILITDDNLFDSVYDSLKRLGIHPSNDILIVTHSNFPARTECIPGVVRVGYDITAVLHHCMDIVDDLARRRKVEMRQVYPPVYEWEVASEQGARAKFRKAISKKFDG